MEKQQKVLVLWFFPPLQEILPKDQVLPLPKAGAYESPMFYEEDKRYTAMDWEDNKN